MCNRKLLAALVAALSPLAAPAATLCVNPGGTGGCLSSIAAAIASAAPAGDTINVAAGTYHEGGLIVDRSVDIVGAGADLTVVDASVGGVNGPATVFQYANRLGITSTLSKMTIRGGQRGVDITGGNTVTIDHARVTANGPATGAGIFNGASTLYVKASTIDNNSATDEGSIGGCDWGGASGGGIASLCGGGNNYITDSTITGNTAGRWGGGLIVNDGQTVIENTTISNNNANFPDPNLTGGALFVGGAVPDVLLRFTTIANNGGTAMFGDEKTRIYASLLQGNAAGACPATPSHQTSLGYNVVSDASCPFAATGDLVSTNAQLQPLAMNGGPTATHAIPANSPAVDRVPVVECTVFDDQRGVARPQHAGCDAGAYEHTFTVRELTAVLVAQLTGPGISNGLRNMISQAFSIVAERNPGAACNVLASLRHQVNLLGQRRVIPGPKATAIIMATEELAHAIGC
jgi:hypothetical protein